MADDPKLNKEQEEAVLFGKGPLLVIAGAGTGKTTVITHRITYLILKKNVSPQHILALTFTEKAAQEMEERVDKAMPYGYTQMWISTFHAFCDRILRQDAIHIGLNPAYKLMSQSEAVLFLRKHMFSFEFDYFRPLGNPNKFLEGLIAHFSRLQDEDIIPSQYLAYAKRLALSPKQQDEEKLEARKIGELANVFTRYQALKIKESVMDFADLISYALYLLRTRKNILSSYQQQFKYILVDEFQDTNFAQNELALLLAGKDKNITVVGDDDQAIYRWRGAAISNIIHFQKRFPKSRIITLTKNYRSTKEILSSSYRAIQYNNPDRLEIKSGINKKLVSQRNIDGNPVTLLFGKRVEDEASLVSKKIQELVEKTNRSYRDFALLVRANDHAQPFVRALGRAKIPYQFLGPGHLFHKEEIKDLIAYLKVLYNLEDATSLYRTLTMEVFSINSKDISLLLSYARSKNLTLFEAIENPPLHLLSQTKETLNTIASMIKRHLTFIPKETAGQILYYFLEDSGLLRFYMGAATEQNVQKSQNVALFFDKLKTHEVSFEDSSVFAVVDWIDLSMQLGEGPLASDSDWILNNAVNILTVHASKGLEFPVVFLVNLVTLRFPTRDRNEQIPIPTKLVKEILPQGDYHLQEERRLFYVGMTRARDELFLTSAHLYAEGKRERKVSPFVAEALGQQEVDRYIKEVISHLDHPSSAQLTLLDWTPKTEQAHNVLFRNLPITYLSYSQIQTFGVCPLHYKLKYILKIPTPQSAAQSFGTSIHATLRDFYQAWIQKQPLRIKDIPGLLSKNWVNEGYTTKAHEQKAKQKAETLVINYLTKEYNRTSPLSALTLEMPFKFSLKDPENPKRIITIGGRIDRVDKVGKNRIEIIDYKTGTNVPDQRKLKEDLQLGIYALAATYVQDAPFLKNANETILSLLYLDEGIKLSITKTKEELENAKQDIFQKAQEMEASSFLCSKSSLCKPCEYRMLCQT